MSDIDLDAPGVAKELAKKVLNDIDATAVKLYNEGPRSHLGASIIGKPCARQLWFGFRWVEYEIHSGRQYRLFNRGHKEEARFTEWLKLAGYNVQEINPETGKQWRVSSINGHFGGSQDGVIYLPAKYNYSQPLLLEYKTNGTGASFNKLIANGCSIGKPQHFDQQCVYGYLANLTHSLYLNVCKNDDNIYPEIIKLDPKRGQELERKAHFIIHSQEPPPRISEQQTHPECKFCQFIDVCHCGREAEKNCRSCVNARPVENAQWYCEKHSGIIPPDFVKVGCDYWKDITK